MSGDWLAQFPDLLKLDPASLKTLRDEAKVASFPAGTPLFRGGDLSRNYLLVLDGQVRVQKVAESGREIVLYRVEPGQSCVLTTACLLSDIPYGAEGVAESELKAVVLPSGTFHRLTASSEGFRRFVFAAYSTRLSELLCLIEEVAFGRIDKRLAGFLSERAGSQGEVKATHQELAVELGTAREVISRQLKDFERRGWVELSRGSLLIRNRTALENLSL
ncbi:MAG TPA: Crp/Fnr family transcriptional regulator [Candidatus Sulfotelmatobacter sp.]|nr:Crp/Fnr family transcriptional regulator [Candidatus Sulfotelmatobacter sp.]